MSNKEGSWSNAAGPPPSSGPAKKAGKKATKPEEKRVIVKAKSKAGTKKLILVPIKLEISTPEQQATLSSLASEVKTPEGEYDTIFINKKNTFIEKLGGDKPFTILSIKHIIADLVHDFTKPVLDRFATDDPVAKTITTLINRLIAPYPDGMFNNDDKAELQTFYNQCTTDAAAKNRFKEALDKYMASNPDLPNITEFLTDEYPTAEGEDPDAIDFLTMFELIYEKYDKKGEGLLFWYLDAQFGNVIENYYKWRVVNHPGGAPNSYCKDLAYITDPASGLNTKNYTLVDRNGPVTMLGGYTVMGLDAGLVYASPDGGFTDAVSLTFEGRPPITITERANSVNQTYSDLDTNPGYDLNTRLDKILSKSGGDRFQGYSANSVLWPETPIIVTNDILASYYYIFFMNCPVLLTGQDAYKLYEFGGGASNVLTDGEMASIKGAIIGVDDEMGGEDMDEKIRAYMSDRIKDSFTRVEKYFSNAMSELGEGHILQFKKIVIPEKDELMDAIDITMIDDKKNIYSISSDTTKFVFDGIKASKLTAALITTLIDLIEKCNIYGRMKIKRDNINDITPSAALLKDDTAKFPIKYKPLLSLGKDGLQYATMRRYMEVFSVFSEQASYSKLALMFTILESDLHHDGVVKIIYDELVSVLRGRVSNNNVPIYLIAMTITMIIYDVSRPTLPVRQSARGPGATANAEDIARRKLFINNITNELSIKQFLFDLIPENLRFTFDGQLYKITEIVGVNFTLQQISENPNGTFVNAAVGTTSKPKQEIITGSTIDGFLYDFNITKGTTNLEQFTPFIGSLVSTCFQDILVEGFTVDAGNRKYRISSLATDQLTGKAHIDSILTPLEPVAADYIAYKKKIEEDNKDLNDAYRGRIEKEKKKRGPRGGRKIPTVSKAALENPKIQIFAKEVGVRRAAALNKLRKKKNVLVGGGGDFNSGIELIEIDEKLQLETESIDIKSLWRCIYNSISTGIQLDDREDIGKLYALSALGDFVSVLDSDDINDYYQAYLKLIDDMYIENIDRSYFYRLDELYLCVAMAFLDAYDAGILVLEDEELEDEELADEEELDDMMSSAKPSSVSNVALSSRTTPQQVFSSGSTTSPPPRTTSQPISSLGSTTYPPVPPPRTTSQPVLSSGNTTSPPPPQSTVTNPGPVKRGRNGPQNEPRNFSQKAQFYATKPFKGDTGQISSDEIKQLEIYGLLTPELKQKIINKTLTENEIKNIQKTLLIQNILKSRPGGSSMYGSSFSRSELIKIEASGLFTTEELSKLANIPGSSKQPIGRSVSRSRSRVRGRQTNDPGDDDYDLGGSSSNNGAYKPNGFGAGGSRKTHRRRHSRRKSNRRTQSRPRKTQRRNRRDRIRHEE